MLEDFNIRPEVAIEGLRRLYKHFLDCASWPEVEMMLAEILQLGQETILLTLQEPDRDAERSQKVMLAMHFCTLVLHAHRETKNLEGARLLVYEAIGEDLGADLDGRMH